MPLSKPGCTSGRLLHYTLGGDDRDDYYYYRISQQHYSDNGINIHSAAAAAA
jgi:hypothetical protein